MHHRIWHFWGHINLTLVIIALMMVDLFAGYSPLKHHPELFTPINDIGFYQWAGSYGRYYLKIHRLAFHSGGSAFMPVHQHL